MNGVSEHVEAIRRILRNERDRQGMTIAELAEAMGVSPSTVSRMEAGPTLISLTHFLSACVALDIDPCDALDSRDLPPRLIPLLNRWDALDEPRKDRILAILAILLIDP